MKTLFRSLTSRLALTLLLLLSLLATAILSLAISHYKKEKKPIALDTLILQQKLAAPPPEWMIRRIKTDLSRFAETGITRQMIDDLFQGERIRKYSLIRFQILNHHLSFALDEKQLDSRHFRHLLASLKKLNESIPLPDVDFVLSLEDGFDTNPPNFPISPCLVFAKNEQVDNFVLIPDFKALGGYGKLRQQILDGNRKHPWLSKSPLAFWRGSTTSGFFTSDNNWEQFCRGKLVLLSLLHPQLDARFTSVVQCTSEVPSLMKTKKMVSSAVEKIDHLRYKYLVDVDGNSCSYERYFWVLLSNSLVLKQITPNIQWYYGGLEPYVHFLPLKEDLSDLLEKINWAQEHDEESRLMAERSTEFVRENLSTESVFLYMALFLAEYAKLQNQISK